MATLLVLIELGVTFRAEWEACFVSVLDRFMRHQGKYVPCRQRRCVQLDWLYSPRWLENLLNIDFIQVCRS